MTFRIGSALVAMGFICTVGASPAYAQATRTWVSGLGDDANPCSRTAPCKTFPGAYSRTAVGGEIDCIDPGGFGTITIGHSITIDCRGTFASILTSSGAPAVVINDSSGAANVVLRGIAITGIGSGGDAVRFLSGRSLVMEDVLIQDSAGLGISFTPAGAARLYVNDVTITGNAGGGVFIQPTATGTANVIFQNVRLQDNAGTEFRIDTANGTGVVAAILNDVQFTGGVSGLAINGPAVGGPIGVSVAGCTIEQNSGFGIALAGPNAHVRVSACHITGNGTGISVTGGGSADSYGDNLFGSNGTNGSFSSTITKL
jgi:hypothetical protein